MRVKCNVWEDLKGEGWSGVDENYSYRRKEGCLVLMSDKLWKCVTDYNSKDARIVWLQYEIL